MIHLSRRWLISRSWRFFKSTVCFDTPAHAHDVFFLLRSHLPVSRTLRSDSFVVVFRRQCAVTIAYDGTRRPSIHTVLPVTRIKPTTACTYHSPVRTELCIFSRVSLGVKAALSSYSNYRQLFVQKYSLLCSWTHSNKIIHSNKATLSWRPCFTECGPKYRTWSSQSRGVDGDILYTRARKLIECRLYFYNTLFHSLLFGLWDTTVLPLLPVKYDNPVLISLSSFCLILSTRNLINYYKSYLFI